MRNEVVMDKEMEKAIIKVANSDQHDHDVYLEDYQKIVLYIYNENVLKNILHSCKFKDIGNIYDYPEDIPQPDYIDGLDLAADFSLFKRLAISEKYNAVAFYTVGRYEISCAILIDLEKLKKFSKKTKEILQQDSRANMFREINFKCEKREYIEIAEATGDKMKPADVTKKKVEKEKLVFDSESTIVQVMNDIMLFFRKETHKMYERLHIAYKRGVILYGDPGNGKSAMIRELIRSVPDVTKIVINPNVSSVTRILSSLMRSLDGKQAIIIIEDIDSLITNRNRSEFLNILDGVEVKSGVYFIGTTNYPDRIDPAFMNRSGRFDRMFKIDNPSEATRKKYFESREVGDILKGYKVYKDDKKEVTEDSIVDLFVQHSTDLAMASLKEVITSTAYALASNKEMSIEEAIETTHSTLTENKAEHAKMHVDSEGARRRRFRDDDEDDE